MKPFHCRALAMTLASAAFLSSAARVDANVRLLPTNGEVASADTGGQNISTRWTQVTEIKDPSLGEGYRAKFSQNEAYVWSDFSREMDISSYDGMYFLLKNTGTTPSQSSVELHSYLNGVESGKFVISIGLQPGETKRIVTYFDHEWAPKQMGTYPPQLDVPAQIFGVGGQWNFNKTRVKGWLMWNTGGAATVELNDLRLVKKRRDFAGMIDAYGQKADMEWNSKVHSDADLVSNNVQEANELASLSDAPTAPGSVQFGKTTATGRWRFERAPTGNWFAVNPEGGRTWIVGANNLYMDGQMILDNKEEMYASLPPKEGPYGQFYKTAPYFATGQWLRTFDMYRANLYRKYGSSYETAWRNRMNQRMRKWGINAAAGTFDTPLVATGVPFIQHFQMSGFPTKLNVPAPYWTSPNDPYAPTFGPWCYNVLKPWLANVVTNKPKNLIGVAIGNEETWGFVSEERWTYQIPIAALNAPSTQPCKAPMIAILTKKHGTIAKLNAAWGTSFSSWASLNAPNVFGGYSPTINAGMRADFKLMLTAYADKLYSTIRAQMLKSGYTGLFVGSRDALDQTPDEVLAVQGKYVDAHTINNYESDDKSWARIAKMTKPVILTEFSFSAVDRGHNSPNKNFEVGTQADRAVRVRGYLNRAASVKSVAGVFFYGFSECPFSGRWSDDERLNVGLVDMTDTPYKEVTNAFRAFGVTLPNQRRVR